MYSSFPASGRRYSFNWPFLERSHVFVTVAGTPVGFAWLSNSEVELKLEPAPGTTVEVYRWTPLDASFVEFVGAANLTQDDLRRSRLQVLYAIQERLAGSADGVAGAANAVGNDLQALITLRAQLEATVAALETALGDVDDIKALIAELDDLTQSTRVIAVDGLAQINTTLTNLLAEVTAGDTTTRAMIDSEATVRATGDTALGSRIDTVTATVDGQALTIAAVQEEVEALASGSGATAQWVLKVTATRGDGKVVTGGIGVSSTATDVVTQSDIILTADSVKIVQPSDQLGTMKPLFETGNVNGVPAVRIPKAFIGDAAVDTLQLAGQAVTIPVFGWNPGDVNIGVLREVVAVSINSTGAPIALFSGAYCWSDGQYAQPPMRPVSAATFVLRRNGVDLAVGIFGGFSVWTDPVDAGDWSGPGRFAAWCTASMPPFVDTPGAGVHRYSLHIGTAGGVSYARQNALVAIELKR